MPLNSLVKAAKSRTLPQKQIPYQKPAPKFIDGDKASERIEQKNREKTACEDWRECKHLTEANSEYYCNHFMAKCAKEKCNGSMPLLGEKKH